VFRKYGFKIQRYMGNQLFYTGNHLLGNLVPPSGRKILSLFLGTSCNIFIIRKINS